MKSLFLKSLLLISSILLSLIPFTASAETASSDNNYYLGAGAGAIVVDGDSVVGGGMGLSLFGGYRIDETYIVEIGYHHFGEVEDEPATISPRMFSVSALAYHPLSEKLSTFVRLGATSWDADIEFSGVNLRSKGGTDLTAGFGFEFQSSDNVSWRQEYQYFQFDQDQVHTLFFSANYHF